MKYILYKTTNVVNNFIYIGVHKTANPRQFDYYLGNGVYTNRPNTYEKSKTCFQKAVKQFGTSSFRREVIGIFDTPEEAYYAEGLIVNEEFLARDDVYNMIKGGKINQVQGRKVYQYSANTGQYIQQFNSIADAGKAIGSNGSTVEHSIQLKFQVKGFVFSFEKKANIDLSEFNFIQLTPVYRYDKDGNFDKSYQSLNAASKDSDTSPSYINKAAVLGYLVKDTYYFSFYKFDTYDKARTKQIKSRRVFKYNSDGEFVSGYTSQEIAEKENKHCNITKAIKSRQKDKDGNFWALEELARFNVPTKRIPKKVGKFGVDGKLLQTWESATKCAKEVGTAVKNVLSGKYDYHKGFVYKYL